MNEEEVNVEFVQDDTIFDFDVEGVQIHSECLSQDFDEVGFDPVAVEEDISNEFGYFD